MSSVGFRGAGWRRLTGWWGVWWPISARERSAAGLRIVRRTTGLRLAADGLLAEALQFSIVVGVHGGMAATPQNLVTTVRRLRPGAIWQVIVIGRANLSRTAIRLALGGNARAGMEDTLHLRKGELTPGNRPLVERAVILARDLDLPVAGMAEAERDLGIAS